MPTSAKGTRGVQDSREGALKSAEPSASSNSALLLLRASFVTTTGFPAPEENREGKTVCCEVRDTGGASEIPSKIDLERCRESTDTITCLPEPDENREVTDGTELEDVIKGLLSAFEFLPLSEA